MSDRKKYGKYVLLGIILKVLITFALILFSGKSSAQEHKGKYHPRTEGWFAYAPYGKPLYADMHPDFVRFDLSSISMNPVYNYSGNNDKRQFHTFGVFGFELPIWRGQFLDGKYDLSISSTLSANLWMDLFESTTSDIVNTDYRIGAPSITFLHKVDLGFFNNYSIYFVPFKHESTHVGDELVLQRKDEDYALSRVNVSYNYVEAKFTVNEPMHRFEQCHTFRGGVMMNMQFDGGWYFVEDRDGDIYQVPGGANCVDTNAAGHQYAHGPTGKNFEWYLQYQYQSPVAKCGIQGVASVEYRNRLMYGYDLYAKNGAAPTAATQDGRANTVNVFVGMRINNPVSRGYLSHFAIGMRAYYGNCPYGQFRSIPGFSQVGLCVIYE